MSMRQRWLLVLAIALPLVVVLAVSPAIGKRSCQPGKEQEGCKLAAGSGVYSLETGRPDLEPIHEGSQLTLKKVPCQAPGSDFPSAKIKGALVVGKTRKINATVRSKTENLTFTMKGTVEIVSAKVAKLDVQLRYTREDGANCDKKFKETLKRNPPISD